MEKANNVHSHSPDGREKIARNLVNEAKKKAVETVLTTKNIVADICANVTHNAVSTVLPTPNNLTQTICRERRINNAHPRNPTNLVELQIPNNYLTTTKGENFLLFDSGPAEKRLIIFATKSNLEFLRRCDEWYADGTFKTAPPLFTHIYTIHGNYSIFFYFYWLDVCMFSK